MSALKDLKVIELASVLAGPLVGTFFAEAGAQVYKYENRSGGDLTRNWKGKKEEFKAPVSAYYAAANFGKNYRRLDLDLLEDRQYLLDELTNCDILVTNFKTTDYKKFKLEHEELKQQFPQLIHGQITGFPDDPFRTAFDMVLQAESGLLSMTGESKEHLAKIPVAMIDMLAAHQLKEGILLALLERNKTGIGALVQVSLYDSALSGLINQASSWLMNEHQPEPLGTLHPSIAPYGEILTCKDGKKLVLAVGNNQQFMDLCACLDLQKLSTDERFSTNPKRVLNRSELLFLLQEKASEFYREPLFTALTEKNVPIGRIRSLEEVFDDEAAKTLILEENIDGIATRRISGNVFRIYPNS